MSLGEIPESLEDVSISIVQWLFKVEFFALFRHRVQHAHVLCFNIRPVTFISIRGHGFIFNLPCFRYTHLNGVREKSRQAKAGLPLLVVCSVSWTTATCGCCRWVECVCLMAVSSARPWLPLMLCFSATLLIAACYM